MAIARHKAQGSRQKRPAVRRPRAGERSTVNGPDPNGENGAKVGLGAVEIAGLERIAEKRRRGQRLNRDDLRTLERVKRARDQAGFEVVCRVIPKKWIAAAAGRQHKTLNEAAIRYGTPVGGKTVDLGELVRWIFDFLAGNARKLAAVNGEDPMSGEVTPALERWRGAKADREEFFRDRDFGEWVARDDVHEGLALFASILRRAGERLERECGPRAHDILDKALTEAADTLRRRFDETETGNGQEAQ